MKIGEATTMARQWVTEHLEGEPDFDGAYLVGSTTTLPPDADLPTGSDVDIMVVKPRPPATKLGKFRHRGVLLEVSYLTTDQLADATTALSNYHVAAGLNGATILADPHGHLTTLHHEVAARFRDEPQVRRRCQSARDNATRMLHGAQQPSPSTAQRSKERDQRESTADVQAPASGISPSTAGQAGECHQDASTGGVQAPASVASPSTAGQVGEGDQGNGEVGVCGAHAPASGSSPSRAEEPAGQGGQGAEAARLGEGKARPTGASPSTAARSGECHQGESRGGVQAPGSGAVPETADVSRERDESTEASAASSRWLPRSGEVAGTQRVMSWLFGTGVTTHVVLVAGLRNPTVRLRYLAAREVLEAYGRGDFHEELLGLLGCRDMTGSRAAEHLERLAVVFDATVAVARTAFPYSSDVTAAARPIAIDGTAKLIRAGDHREVVFWIAAGFARCQTILEVDDPEAAERFAPYLAELLGDLGIASVGDVDARARRSLEFLPRVWDVAEEIMAANPDVVRQSSR